jgi:hypothetical protein
VCVQVQYSRIAKVSSIKKKVCAQEKEPEPDLEKSLKG